MRHRDDTGSRPDGRISAVLGRLAQSAAGHWKRSLAIAGAILVALIALVTLAGGSFSDDFSTSGTDSQAAIDLLEERFPTQSGDTADFVFAVDEGTLSDGERPAAIAATVAEIRSQSNVTAAENPLSSGSAGHLGRRPDRLRQGPVRPARDRPRPRGRRAARGGGAIAERAGIEVSRRGQVVDQAQESAVPVGELIGLAVAIIVLTLVFRSARAMAITLASALLALIGGVLMLTLASNLATFPSFAPTLGVMLGLGAGIDYALLVVGRHREQLAAGDSVADAARTANSTAGASVLAAGLIVVVAISGLLVVGIPSLGTMGVGSAIVIAVVAVGAITLLPALLGAAGKRLTPKRPEANQPSDSSLRWNRGLTRRPWLAAGAGLLILLVLSAPLTALRLGQPDDGNDQRGSTTQIAYDRLAEGFGPGVNGPLVLAAALPDGADPDRVLGPIEAEIAATPGVAAVAPALINPTGDAATITAIPGSSPQDQATSDLVSELRETVLPAAVSGSGAVVHVGGSTATFDDLAQRVAERLPLFVALVVGLSVLLLMAVFRSLWVPIVSAAFNLLSISAAYGVVVAVFQLGWAARSSACRGRYRSSRSCRCSCSPSSSA